VKEKSKTDLKPKKLLKSGKLSKRILKTKKIQSSCRAWKKDEKIRSSSKRAWKNNENFVWSYCRKIMDASLRRMNFQGNSASADFLQ
jgi:hypothetical protein